MTPRELEILSAAARGETVPETARRLWLSPETIKYHRTNIRHELFAHNMTHAVAIAFRKGLLS